MKWLLVAISIICGACGQLFMKVGMKTLGSLAALFPAFGTGDLSAVPWLGVLWLLAGIACYGIAMVVWIYVLGHFELSVAYPLLSMGYILVYLGAVLWPQIGESFTLTKTGGILLIMLGVALVAAPSKVTKHE
jgi:undecaprenyl phosphate-alpha-L-ara4N flippase subunit ArnF